MRPASLTLEEQPSTIAGVSHRRHTPEFDLKWRLARDDMLQIEILRVNKPALAHVLPRQNGLASCRDLQMDLCVLVGKAKAQTSLQRSQHSADMI